MNVGEHKPSIYSRRVGVGESLIVFSQEVGSKPTQCTKAWWLQWTSGAEPSRGILGSVWTTMPLSHRHQRN